FGTAQTCRFSETMCFGTLEGADDDGLIHFSCRPPVGSRWRDVDDFRNFLRLSTCLLLLIYPESPFQSIASFLPDSLFLRLSHVCTLFFSPVLSPEGRMNKPIVISTLESSKTHCFRESTILSCVNSGPTLSQTASYMKRKRKI
ncbi:hypothetical protein PRIPAC_89959, partial [Pristionchus pacificus]|uniref:Uncharacterized protein n=1 Tax=Pristionchus pacificus TaxID=54126 RepID=A0A2A6B712_PRIPA